MKTRVWKYLLGGGIVLAIMMGVVLAYGYLMLFRPIPLNEPTTVVITKETSFGYLASRLQQRGLIPNAFAFKAYAYLTGQSNRLKIGEYEVTIGQRPVDILETLVSGRARIYQVTVPEGKWISEYDRMLTTYWPETAINFRELIRQPDRWKARYPFIEGNSLEGYLFPDTYRFVKGVSADKIISTMLDRFQITCLAAYRTRPATDRRSLREVLILASLVEGEAKRDSERAIIAGVYMNRLRDGWTMDCDATLIYALQQRVTRVLNRDKLIDSPYNSYKRRGLPPGPINNPGLKSFQAALHPAAVPYYFYVARGDGSHIFSRTMAEQQRAIQQVRGN